MFPCKFLRVANKCTFNAPGLLKKRCFVFQKISKKSMKSSADPRFFTLVQHARSKLLDNQRRSGILSHKIEVNRVRLHFETTGDGPHTILLLPGALGSTRTDFDKQLTDYNKRDFTLISMDFRGFGKSIPPERTWPLDYFQRDADDALELCNKLDLKNISILGWSDGGNTGMIMAAKAPELIKNLVVWGANAYITQADMDTFERIRDVGDWSERMRVPFLDLYGEKYFKTQWSNWVDAYWALVKERKADVCKDELTKIKANTLVIHGLKDPLVPLEHADYLHKNIKGSKLYIMPEGKHNLHIRYHREFNFLTEQFLKGHHSHS